MRVGEMISTAGGSGLCFASSPTALTIVGRPEGATTTGGTSTATRNNQQMMLNRFQEQHYDEDDDHDHNGQHKDDPKRQHHHLQLQAVKLGQRLEHLNKKSRIELLGAKNDHNYSSSASPPPPPQQQPPPATQSSQLINSNDNSTSQRAADDATSASPDGTGPMDDCTAAMVLMFLSSRPTPAVVVGGDDQQTIGKQDGAATAANFHKQTTTATRLHIGDAYRQQDDIKTNRKKAPSHPVVFNGAEVGVEVKVEAGERQRGGGPTGRPTSTLAAIEQQPANKG